MDAYRALCAEAEAQSEWFWSRLAKENVLLAQTVFARVDESKAPFYRWFDVAS